MTNSKYFDDFLKDIEPSQSTVDYISSVQDNLRSYLLNHSIYKSVITDTFLSGSYAKHTSIRPAANSKKRDVDIVVVTNYTRDKNSIEVLKELCNVLKEKELYNTAKVQSHSVSVELSNISIDVVPVIEHEFLENIYYIGSSKSNFWRITDPKGHISWSTEVNKNNQKKYKPLVKIFKWWRNTNCPTTKKYPKGITLEKIIADNLGDPSLSIEDFLIDTMQNIVNSYIYNCTLVKTMPYISDPSKRISGGNLLEGYLFEDFKAFIEKLKEHIELLNENGTTNETWKSILGKQFPGDSNNTIDYSSYLSVAHRKPLPWPMRRSGAAFITAVVQDCNNSFTNYENNSYEIGKKCEIVYTAHYNSHKSHRVVWQIVNTGIEARNSFCLRGGFETSNDGKYKRRETTQYTGKHYVQCFIIDDNNQCVAKSKEFFINVE